MRWKILIAVLAAPVAACSTAAETENSRMNAVATENAGPVNACQAKAQQTPAYLALAPYLNTSEAPSLAAQANTSLATPDQVRNIFEYHAAIAPCRRIFLETAGRINPALVGPIAEGFAKSDALYLALAERRMTWGQFVQSRHAVSLETERETAQIAQSIQRGLGQSHQAELARRQQAASALLAWSQQQQLLYQNQQLINAATQPRVTNCQYIGAQLNCTTF